jgi:hypothetical protein
MTWFRRTERLTWWHLKYAPHFCITLSVVLLLMAGVIWLVGGKTEEMVAIGILTGAAVPLKAISKRHLNRV